MSDSTTVLTRFVVVLFFAAVGAGAYGVMTHNQLQAAEQNLSKLEQERETLKDRLVTSEKSVVDNSTAAKTCTAELESFKTRAAAEPAPESAKTKKVTPHPSAG